MVSRKVKRRLTSSGEATCHIGTWLQERKNIILNLLAKIPGLKVIARTSSFAFRGKEQDVRKIAEALDVKTIVEGSVRRSGNRIRVTAQLISAEDGAHLWSERYDRELADVFEVQDEIASAISGALKLKLAAQPSAETYKPSLPAYEAYLKGQHHYYNPTPASLSQAKEYYEQAISLDPKFALPYAALAAQRVTLATAGLRPSREAMPQAEAWAQKALEIDPYLQDAHAVLGMKAFLFDYDWSEAERRFSLALAREPVSAFTCTRYTTYKLVLGRAGEAEGLMRPAVEADPLSAISRWVPCEDPLGNWQRPGSGAGVPPNRGTRREFLSRLVGIGRTALRTGRDK
jgi:tetratricopeptide (TPR) repeat protein